MEEITDWMPPHCKPCTDHTGKHFKTMRDMARAWGISYEVMRYRVKFQGMTLRQALELGDRRKVHDHRGQEFSSVTSMCRYWRISSSVYLRRIKSGMSVRDALTLPVEYRNSPCRSRREK